MTSGDKASDLSSRLKRPARSSSRTSKSNATSATISTPPRAALASNKSQEDELHRRKDPFQDMLLKKPNKNNSEGVPPIAEGDQQHKRNASLGGIRELKATDRIIELEKALAVAIEEQELLRLELRNARQQNHPHRQNTEDRRQHLLGSSPPPNPSHDVGIEVQRKASLPRENENLAEQNFELRGRLLALQDQLVEQDVLYKARIERELSRSEAEWNELTRRLHHSEKESQERLQQLLDLKHSISALTRMDTQVTDAELAERMDHLYHRVREWVISNFRRSKLDLSNVPKDVAKTLETVSLSYATTSPTDKIAFYQAVFICNLMYIFREPVCIGLPDTGPLSALPQLARYIHDAGSDYREWRRSTIRAIENSQAKATLVEGREKLLQQIAQRIREQLRSVSGVSLPSATQSSLLVILQYAADLQHVLLLQRAHYKIHYFRPMPDDSPLEFDPSRMESISDEDDSDDEMSGVRKVEFCVFPMLEKFGDEEGNNLEVSNIIRKARVCCGVG